MPTPAAPKSHTTSQDIQRADIEKRINTATAKVVAIDRELLAKDVNERTISHRLAHYLQVLFPDKHVDCEYNRSFTNPGRPKTLRVPKSNVGWEDTHARTVYPDIIVHTRGSEDNILVIEVKKAGLSTSFDEDKLRAYQREYGYRFAYLLIVRTGDLDPGFDSPRLIALAAS